MVGGGGYRDQEINLTLHESTLTMFVGVVVLCYQYHINVVWC